MKTNVTWSLNFIVLEAEFYTGQGRYVGLAIAKVMIMHYLILHSNF